MNTTQKSGLLYDANAVSGFLSGNTLIEKPSNGHIVICYGGWNYDQLRRFPAGEKHIGHEYAYDNECRRVVPGYYRLLLPVPDSNNKDRDEQIAHLRTLDAKWQPAPIVVVATALIVHLAKTGEDLLDLNNNDYCRCLEQSSSNLSYGFGLAVSHSRVRICELTTTEYHRNLWLAACRRC